MTNFCIFKFQTLNFQNKTKKNQKQENKDIIYQKIYKKNKIKMSYSEGLQEITEDNENIVLESFKLLQLRTVENERNNNIFSEEEQRV